MTWVASNGGGFGAYNSSSYMVGGKPAEKIPNSYPAYAQQAYGSSSVVGACMRVRRDLVSQARFTWRELTEDGAGKLKHDDGLAVLDNPWPNGTTGELLAKMITDVDLCGNAFVVNDGDRLRWRRPDWMYIVLSGDPLVEYDVDVIGYVYTPGGTGIEGGKAYLVDEVAHWSPQPLPGAEYVGMSWMMSALRDIQGDIAATEHKLSFFENGTQLGPIYTLPATLTADQFKKFREGNELAHAGSRNAYKAQYIGGGATVTLAASTFQQLELKATVGANETRIAALAGTHPSIVGLSEGLQGASLNAGNFTAARRLVADITLMRLWQDLCATLQTFVDPPDGYELWIRERAIPFMREDAKDAADIFATEVETVTKGVREGFEPDSMTQATQQRNILLLKHSGLMSVQLQPPGSGTVGPDGMPVEGALSDDAAQIDEGITEFLGEEPVDFGALRRARAFNEALHPRNAKGTAGGGRFRSIAQRIVDGLKSGKGSKDANPFDEFDEAPLRQVAQKRGIDIPEGTDRDGVADALLGHVTGGKTPDKPKAPAKKAAARKAAPTKRPKGSGPGSGKDLTADDKGAALAEDVSRAATEHEDPDTGIGPRGDERLRAIVEAQGFDGPPKVVARTEMDRLVRSGHIEVFRGVADHVDSGRSGAELAQEYRTGDLHFGNGTFGNGTYTTTSESAADEYAQHGWRNETSSGQVGETMRMALPPHARIVDYADLQEEHNAYLRGVYAEAPVVLNAFGFPSWEDIPSDARTAAFTDIGRYAAARGYDAVRIPGGAVAGGEGHFQYNILNRSAVVVQE